MEEGRVDNLFLILKKKRKNGECLYRREKLKEDVWQQRLLEILDTLALYGLMVQKSAIRFWLVDIKCVEN